MRYCTECQRLLTMDELRHELGGKCFDCFWLAPSSGIRAQANEADYWRSDEAMEND